MVKHTSVDGLPNSAGSHSSQIMVKHSSVISTTGISPQMMLTCHEKTLPLNVLLSGVRAEEISTANIRAWCDQEATITECSVQKEHAIRSNQAEEMV